MGKTLLSMTNHNLGRWLGVRVRVCVFFTVYIEINYATASIQFATSSLDRANMYTVCILVFNFEFVLPYNLHKWFLIASLCYGLISFFNHVLVIHTRFFSYEFHLIVIQLGVIVLNIVLNISFKSSFRFVMYLGVSTAYRLLRLIKNLRFKYVDKTGHWSHPKWVDRETFL